MKIVCIEPFLIGTYSGHRSANCAIDPKVNLAGGGTNNANQNIAPLGELEWFHCPFSNYWLSVRELTGFYENRTFAFFVAVLSRGSLSHNYFSHIAKSNHAL